MPSTFPAEVHGGGTDYPEVREYPVNAGQTFTVGALVFLTGNKISECGSNPSAILGIALAPASSSTLHPLGLIPVAIITPEMTVKMGSATTPTDAFLGVEQDIVKTGNNWLVASTTSNPRVTVVDYSPRSGQAGQEWWLVRFRGNELQLSNYGAVAA